MKGTLVIGENLERSANIDLDQVVNRFAKEGPRRIRINSTSDTICNIMKNKYYLL